MRVSVAAGLVLTLLCVAASARAGTPAADAEQQAHFDAGNAKYNEGEYADALAKYQAAYAVQHHPYILINIATTYERLYQHDEARKAYESFLASDAPGDSEFRTLADKRLRVLRMLPGSIIVDAGTPDAQVTVSGTGVARRDVAKEKGGVRFDQLPPGDYHIRVELRGYVRIDQEITLAPGVSHAITERLQREKVELTVISTPGHARVFIDDQDTGHYTDFNRKIDVGEHEVRLELDDRKPWKQKIRVEVGSPVLLDAKMPPPPRSGRTEMMLAGMAFGGYAAPALAVAVGGTRLTTGNNLLIPVALGLVGAGVGLLGSWLVTDEGMKVGHSSIITGATLWGGLAGASLAFGLGLNANEQRTTQQNTLAFSLLGGGLGLGAGILTARYNDTSPGDAALVNSGALWGTLSMTLLTEAISLRKPCDITGPNAAACPPSRGFDHDTALGWLTLGGNVVGLTTGAVLARYLEVSRGHVAVFDAAVLLGGVLGYGIGYGAGDSVEDSTSGTVCIDANSRCISGSRWALGGMALAMFVAAPLVGRLPFEVPKTEALFQRHGERWALGIPKLRIGAAFTPRGIDQQLVLDLARGEW